jgi:anti-sigma regulatory factor (Ser/Thr protein kinase)
LLLLDAELASGPDAAGEARRRVGSLSGGLSGRVVEDVTLLVSELVTNAFRHAGTTEGDPIHLRVFLEERTLRVEVVDAGTSGRPRVKENAAEGGWGLRIVQELADRWGTESGPSGTTVWLELESV